MMFLLFFMGEVPPTPPPWRDDSSLSPVPLYFFLVFIKPLVFPAACLQALACISCFPLFPFFPVTLIPLRWFATLNSRSHCCDTPGPPPQHRSLDRLAFFSGLEAPVIDWLFAHSPFPGRSLHPQTVPILPLRKLFPPSTAQEVFGVGAPFSFHGDRCDPLPGPPFFSTPSFSLCREWVPFSSLLPCLTPHWPVAFSPWFFATPPDPRWRRCARGELFPIPGHLAPTPPPRVLNSKDVADFG